VNYQLQNYAEMKKMRRGGKSGGEEDSRRLHLHAPLTYARAVATSNAENLQRRPYPLSWKNVKLIFYSGMTNKDQEMAHFRCQFP